MLPPVRLNVVLEMPKGPKGKTPALRSNGIVKRP